MDAACARSDPHTLRFPPCCDIAPAAVDFEHVGNPAACLVWTSFDEVASMPEMCNDVAMNFAKVLAMMFPYKYYNEMASVVDAAAGLSALQMVNQVAKLQIL